MKRLVLDRYAEAKMISSESLEKLRIKFDDDYILFYVYKEVFHYDAKNISSKLDYRNLDEIDSFSNKVKEYCLSNHISFLTLEEAKVTPIKKVVKEEKPEITKEPTNEFPEGIEEDNESTPIIDMDLLMREDLLDELVRENYFSNEFISLLKEYFTDEEIICFVLNEYLKYPISVIKSRFKDLDEEVINSYHLKVKSLVDELDKNEDPIPHKIIMSGSTSMIDVNAKYNGPRYPRIILEGGCEADTEDVSMDEGYLSDIENS